MTEESKLFCEFIYCACGCKKTRPQFDSEGREYRFISGHQFKPYRREKHYKWKNGRRKHGKYMGLLKPDHPFHDNSGYVLEHRLIYEEYHKCCLLPWIDIHHINHNPQDNRIENLQPMTRPEHSRYHNLKILEERRKEINKRICSYCGSNKTPFHKKERYYIWYVNPKDKTKWLCNKCYIKYKRGTIVI